MKKVARWLALATSWISLAGCGADETVSATEVVVIVDSDLRVGQQLTKIEVTVQTEDGTRAVGTPFPFVLAPPGAQRPNQQALPLSFGVAKAPEGAERFRVTVMGYGPGPNGAETVVVAQKALLGFQDRRTLRARVFLGSACFQNLCSGTGDQVCYALADGGVAMGDCGPVRVAPLEPIDPGDAADAGVARTDVGSPDAGPIAPPPDADIRAPIEDMPTPPPTLPDDMNTPDAGARDSQVRTLSASLGHVCAVRADGAVACWGANGFGQLGNGNNDRSSVPLVVGGLTDALEVTSGLSHSCARRRDGSVVCWGRNENGQLGNGTRVNSAVPVPVSGLTDAVEIAAGMSHSCARRADDTVACWGWNIFGQLGDGTLISSSVPVNAPGLTGVRSLAWSLEGGETCGIERGRTVRCVSDSATGEVQTARVAGLADVYGLASGDSTTCVNDIFGDVSCRAPNQTYRPVQGVTGVAQVAVGSGHVCGVRHDRTVLCWGANQSGQLGGGVVSATSGPTAARGLNDAVEIATGTDFSCARRADLSIVCWGSNAYGVLGPSAPMSSATPVPIAGI